MQAQSQLYQDQYNKHALEARRLLILMNAMQEERMLLSSSAAAAQATRQSKMVTGPEMNAKRRDLDREIEALDRSARYYSNASESMSRMYASVEVEIQRLEQDIDNLANQRPLTNHSQMQ